MTFPCVRFRVFVILALLFSIGPESRAQDIFIGFKGGVVLNNDMQEVSRGGSESKRGEFGPVVEFKWPSGFAAEASFLYRRVGYDSAAWGIPADVTYRIRANSWEVPVTAKYYLAASNRNAQAFVLSGYVLRALSGAAVKSQTLSYPGYELITNRGAANLKNSVNPGPTFGGGVQFGSGRIRFSPEFRYTRWLLVPFNEEGSKGYRVHSAANQVNFRMSLSFAARRATKLR